MAFANSIACGGEHSLELLTFHKSHGRLATMTAVRPPARFGHIELSPGREGWINGAFFVLEPGVFDYIDSDVNQWERARPCNASPQMVS